MDISSKFLSSYEVMDISSNRLFKAVRVCDYTETKNRPFLEIKFAKKGIDALNLSNILNKKSVQSYIPPYFQNKKSSCISYSYTRSVASKMFNYKRPPWGRRGFKSRIRPPYPQRVVKGD